VQSVTAPVAAQSFALGDPRERDRRPTENTGDLFLRRLCGRLIGSPLWDAQGEGVRVLLSSCFTGRSLEKIIMENTIDELLGNIGHTEAPIDDRISEAALSGEGLLLVKFEDERRKQSAQEFASKCKSAQDRLEEIKAEREHVLRERDAYTAQKKIAAQEWRKAKDIEDERRLEHIELELKIGILDNKLEILREESRERSSQLQQLLATRNGGIN
jgi:hypothetical protein